MRAWPAGCRCSRLLSAGSPRRPIAAGAQAAAPPAAADAAPAPAPAPPAAPRREPRRPASPSSAQRQRHQVCHAAVPGLQAHRGRQAAGVRVHELPRGGRRRPAAPATMATPAHTPPATWPPPRALAPPREQPLAAAAGAPPAGGRPRGQRGRRLPRAGPGARRQGRRVRPQLPRVDDQRAGGRAGTPARPPAAAAQHAPPLPASRRAPPPAHPR